MCRKASSLIKLLRLLRLLRVTARARLRGKLRTGQLVVDKLWGIVTLLVSFVVWAHVTGCIYFWIGCVQDQRGTGLKEPWIVTLFAKYPDLDPDDTATAPAPPE